MPVGEYPFLEITLFNAYLKAIPIKASNTIISDIQKESKDLVFAEKSQPL